MYLMGAWILPAGCLFVGVISKLRAADPWEKVCLPSMLILSVYLEIVYIWPSARYPDNIIYQQTIGSQRKSPGSFYASSLQLSFRLKFRAWSGHGSTLILFLINNLSHLTIYFGNIEGLTWRCPIFRFLVDATIFYLNSPGISVLHAMNSDKNLENPHSSAGFFFFFTWFSS